MKKIIFVLFLVFNSCNYDNCSERIGLELSYHLFTGINVDGKTYCDLINESFDGNEKSIVQLSLVDVYDGATYEHGEVLIELIHNMSERKYTRLIEKLSLSDQKEIYYYLLAGLDFTNNSNFKRQKV